MSTIEKIARRSGDLGPERKVVVLPAKNESPKPLPGQMTMCALHGEGAPKRIRTKRRCEGITGLVVQAGVEMDAVGEAPGRNGLIVAFDDEEQMILKPDDFEVIERHELKPDGLAANWPSEYAGRTPKVVRLVRKMWFGRTDAVPPGEYEYVGPAGEDHFQKRLLEIRLADGTTRTVYESDVEVVEWATEPASKPLAAAARAVKEPPAKSKKPTKAAAPGPTSAGAVAAAQRFDDLPIQRLPILTLQRHPKNRVPKPAKVAKLAESLKERGQIDPLLVRNIPHEHFYQIISGETRWLAAKKNDSADDINCRVIVCSDAEALELLAICNAERTDLDPIEKAEMIVELCKPIVEGGAGYTREQAAKVYGLETGAAASNLVRLLELPKNWQDRVITGELPQSFARFLTPYCAAPNVMKAIDEDYVHRHRPKAKDYEREPWENRSDVEGHIDGLVDEVTRPIDAKNVHRYSGKDLGDWQYAGNYKCLFELTDEVRRTLDVVPLPYGENGKLIDVATNVKAYDKLQVPRIKAQVDAEAKRSAGKAGRDPKPKKPRTMTVVQMRIAEAEAAKQLAARIQGWRHAWLKSLIGNYLGSSNFVPLKIVLAIVATNEHQACFELSQALREALGAKKNLNGGWSGGTFAKSYRALDPFDQIPKLSARAIDAVRGLLAREDKDPRHPLLPFDFIDAIAVELEVDVVEEWRILQTTGDGRARIDTFLRLHTSKPLQRQASEWKIHIDDGKPKQVMLDIILAKVTPLGLPKSIKPLAARQKPAAKPTKKPTAKQPVKKGAK